MLGLEVLEVLIFVDTTRPKAIVRFSSTMALLEIPNVAFLIFYASLANTAVTCWLFSLLHSHENNR